MARIIEDYDTYNYVLKEIGENNFNRRVNELIDTAKAFIQEAGYDDSVDCNEGIMFQVALDFYADILRLKDFHSIDQVRQEKIFAYTIAWIVKRKPLQFVRYNKDEDDIFLNERFAAVLFMNDVLQSGNWYISDSEIKCYKYYLDLLLYYFKYRECNPQVVELAMESFKLGTKAIETK